MLYAFAWGRGDLDCPRDGVFVSKDGDSLPVAFSIGESNRFEGRAALGRAEI